MEYEVVIGMEVHVELKTESKVWCGCPTRFGSPPNTQTCPVCLGLPGSLPVLNRKALEHTINVGLALDCTISSTVSAGTSVSGAPISRRTPASSPTSTTARAE